LGLFTARLTTFDFGLYGLLCWSWSCV